MNLKLINLDDLKDINTLIDNSFNGTCFSYDWFLKLKNVKKILAIFDNNDNLISFMPLFVDLNSKRKLSQSTMYIPYGGPVIIKMPTKERHKIQHIRNIEYMLARYLLNYFDDLSFSTDPKIIDIMPFIRTGFVPEVRYTYKLDLRKSLIDIYSNFGTDRKKEIKRIKNQKIEFVVDNKLRFFDCNKAMVWEKKHNLPTSVNFVKKYILESISNNRGMSFVLKDNEKVLGGVHLVWDKNTAYILYSYYESKGAITYIYYNMIDYLKKNTTVQYLDFEGSVYESIEDFNMSFGAYQDRFYNLHWKKEKKYELYPILYDYGKK